MRYTVRSYSTGRDHRLAFVPEAPAADVCCDIYCPGGGVSRCSLKKLTDSLFVLNYTFRQLGDYLFIVEADGDVSTILKAVVEK